MNFTKPAIAHVKACLFWGHQWLETVNKTSSLIIQSTLTRCIFMRMQNGALSGRIMRYPLVQISTVMTDSILSKIEQLDVPIHIS